MYGCQSPFEFDGFRLLQSRLREVDNASLRLDEARRKHYKGAQKELKVR